jgi:plastocyanin
MLRRGIVTGLVPLMAAMLMVGSSAVAYEVTAVTNGGVIRGVVTYAGRVPTRMVVPTKDQAVCGGPREEPEIRVAAGGGVGDAIVLLKEVAQGKAWPAPAGAPLLDQKSCVFEPAIQAIPAGTLQVRNSDPVLHNTHGFYGRRTAFNLALPNQGQVVEVELQRPGQVRIECDAHGWMLGWVYVVDNPYYALTAEDGSFALSDVPPGTYTLVANQALTGPVEVAVTVAAGETVELSVELPAR